VFLLVYIKYLVGVPPTFYKMEDENNNKRANPKGANKDFPFTTIGVAEDVLLAVDKAGGKINTKALSTSLQIKGGAFARKLSAVKRWGLVSGQGMLSITEIGKKILHPISDEELIQTRKAAFMSVPLFSDLYDRFGTDLPENKTFVAILFREYDIKDTDARTILNIYKNSIKEFLSLLDKDTEDNVNKNAYAQDPKELVEKISVRVKYPTGENVLKANDKKEFEAMKNKLEKLFLLMEDELPDENISDVKFVGKVDENHIHSGDSNNPDADVNSS